MAAVQSLRHEAMAAGNLKQTPQCRCVIQTSGATISILPAEPQVVCVPVYAPAVYGAWAYPAYPPYSFPVPAGFVYEPGFWIGFGPPIALASLGPFWGWGWVDWGRHDIAVDPARYALASGGRAAFSGSTWVHDAVHRGGVAYADPGTRARFDAARVSALTTAARSGVGRGATTAAARFGSAGSDAVRRGAGRFGASATIRGGAAASQHEVPFHVGGGCTARPQPIAGRRSMLARARPTAARDFTAGPHFTTVAEWEVAQVVAACRTSQWVGRMAAAQEGEVAHTGVARHMAVVARTAAAIAAESLVRAEVAGIEQVAAGNSAAGRMVERKRNPSNRPSESKRVLAASVSTNGSAAHRQELDPHPPTEG